MLELRTSAWYGDRPLNLFFPENWRVEVHWPKTPPPLSDADIVTALEQPVAMPRLREFARGAQRPLVLVDDLTRPTPTDRVFPALLRELADAGIAPDRLSILLASGSHGRIAADAIARKVGPEAASACRLLFHRPGGRAVRVGRTSFGTTVRVNPAVAASDLVIGVAGVYPQFSTGFGGGAKLALGALSTSSIARLHYWHSSVHGSYTVDNDFRRDLEEIAQLVGLRWSVSMQVDAFRRPVRVVCGDHEQYYADQVAFARRTFAAPGAADADVVVANGYPMDVSLTFTRSKGVVPLLYASPGASRVLIAACPEGIGLHTLFPFVAAPRFHRQHHVARIIRYTPGQAAARVAARLGRLGRRNGVAACRHVGLRSIWLFAPGQAPGALPSSIPEMTAVYDWSEVIERIEEEQGRARPLKVVVYPCAPLHVLELDRDRSAEAGASAREG